MLEIDEARGNPLPEWANNVPELTQAEAWLLRAFWDLSTERQRSGMGMGPVPWSKIRTYGHDSGLDRGAREILKAVVQALDVAYIEWFAEEAKNARPARQREVSDEQD